MKWALAGAFTFCAVIANWLASKYHWPVPLTSYTAPAGFYAIGIAFVLRDWLQQLAGTRFALAVIPVAGGLSYLIGWEAGWTGLQKIAVASVCAFIVSETLEAAVFAPIRKRRLALGVLASGMVGNAVDSALFLYLAFGSLAYWQGTFIGKAEMICLGAALTAARRRRFPVPA